MFQKKSKVQFLKFWSLLRIDLKSVCYSFSFWIILAIWIVVVFSELYNKIMVSRIDADVVYPTSDFLIELISTAFSIISNLLIVLFSGELIWRSKIYKINLILDATPIKNIVVFISKTIAISTLPIALLFVSVLISILFQISNQFYTIDLGFYLSQFYFLLTPICFNIILAMFIQTIISNKHFGMILTMVVIAVFQTPFSNLLNIQNPSFKLGYFPKFYYDRMVGFGTFFNDFLVFTIHWFLFAMLLSYLTVKLWNKGSNYSLKVKFQSFLFKERISSKISPLVLIMLFLMSVGYISIENSKTENYVNLSSALDLRASYEKKYKYYLSHKTLEKIDVKNELSIFPDKNSYQLDANYILKNLNKEEINILFLNNNESFKYIELEEAELINKDTLLGVYIFEFKKPIKEGETVKLQFQIVKENEGFETNEEIVKNGSYITSMAYEPIFGYQINRQIKDNFERSKRKLEHFELNDELMDSLFSRNVPKINFETTISTNINQIAVSQGELIDHWVDNNRNYFTYKSLNKITPNIGYFSADFDVLTENYQGVSIEVYSSKKNYFNNEHILNAAKKSMDFLSTTFGNYPRKHLRILEVPGHWGFAGFAHSSDICMNSERLFLINQQKDSYNSLTRRIIHEISHQWFGHLLVPKISRGSSILTESFARYSEYIFFEKEFGKDAAHSISIKANMDYFNGVARLTRSEPSLIRSTGQIYLSYGKGLTVLLAIRDLIGDKKLNDLIKQFVEGNTNDPNKNNTLLEFVNLINKNVSKQDFKLIREWFNEVITYDLKIEDASIKHLSNNKFQISLNIGAEKYSGDDKKEIPFEEPIQIGLFKNRNSKTYDSVNIIQLESFYLESVTERINLIVDEVPNFISIDPYYTRPDIDRSNNIYEF